jgi:flagellar L-ring protein precursor FlgH
MKRIVSSVIAAQLVLVMPAFGQSSSIYHKALQRNRQRAEQAKVQEKFNPSASQPSSRTRVLNPQLEAASLIAVASKPPNEFKVHDLITVIVREQLQFESDSKLDTKRKFELDTELEKFFRVFNGHLAAASFTDGKPDIDFKMNTRLKSEGDYEQNDNLKFRMTVEVIDIKPSGQLALAGRQENIVNGESQVMTFSGLCRSQDITPDNTILSTQVFDQRVNVQNKGAVRSAAERGWVLKLIDWLQPF